MQRNIFAKIKNQILNFTLYNGQLKKKHTHADRNS